MRLLLFVFLAGSLAAQAQRTVISVGSTTALTIKTGTVFSADSLVLTPGADFTLSSNDIQVSPVAVNIAPNPSINRVYYLGSQISFTGTIQIYYDPSELNGNPESSLKYTDSAVGGGWLAQSSSSVNTVTHFVQYAAAAHPFIGATASHQGVILPLTLISFAGDWKENGVALEWVISQSGESVNFSIESSTDAGSWVTIGEQAGSPGDGLYTYDYTDRSPAAAIMYYRIKIVHASGEISYSYVVKVQKAESTNVRLVVGNNVVSVYFSGTQPAGIRLINVSGVILRADRTSRANYELNGLFPGAYFLQYELNGQWLTRQFVIL